MSEITVVIPAYNARDTIEQSLISVLDQSVGTVEAIIVDDGSTDGTSAVIEPYVRDKHCALRWIKHAGRAEARNAGMELVGTPYVTFLDADDVLLFDACENLLRVAYEHSADVVYGPHLRYTWQGVQEPVRYMSWVLSGKATRNLRETEKLAGRFPVVTGKLFRTSLLREESISFPDLDAAEDYVFSIRAWMAAKRVHSCTVPVYLRRPFTESRGKTDRPATEPQVRDYVAAIMIVDALCAEREFQELRTTNATTGIRQALRMVTTITNLQERASALGIVLGAGDTLLGANQTFSDVAGIDRESLARMAPSGLTRALVRFWQLSSDLRMAIRNAEIKD